MGRKSKAVNRYPEAKTWGMTTSILQDAVSHIDQLSIVAGGYSSRHLHKHKSNTFIVHTGELIIRVWPEGMKGGLTLRCARDHTLEPGDEPLTVARNTVHQFVAAYGPVVATEVYTLMPPEEPLAEGDKARRVRVIDRFDICRYSENGVLKECEVNRDDEQ